MACFLPLRPFMFRTLGFSVLSSFGKSFHLPKNPLLHFRATERLALTLAALLLMASVDCRPPSKRTLHKIFGLSAYSDRKTLFSRSVSGKRLENVALFPKSPVHWVWLPIPRWGFLAFRSLRTFFSSQRS